MTSISDIIRGVAAEVGRGNTYYNDKLKDGTRSIKVWGFHAQDYDILETRLMNAGYGVKRVKTPGEVYYGHRLNGSTRLHVREAN
jgi:hypothetical protein